MILLFILPLAYIIYQLFVAPKFNPLRRLPGPPVNRLFGNHLYAVLDPAVSSKVYDTFVRKYGRSVRIVGVGPWDQRLLTMDPVSLSHVLKHTTIYEKPWQSRRLITSLIGCGMLSAEGLVHKRQRRVATPAFSLQNLRALEPLVFQKATELRDRWADILSPSGGVLDVCHWISRATFDVIGLAGFDYNFNAIRDESNELFLAYKDMFEVAISQSNLFRTIFAVYLPYLSNLFPDRQMRTVRRCQEVIHRVAGELIQEKKRKILQPVMDAQMHETPGRDLLSLLLKSNNDSDLPLDHRISDQDILNNINTFMFAGSDTTSLTLTWTLYLLAEHPALQTRLRRELAPVTALISSTTSMTDEEIHSIYLAVSELPYLHNVIRECLRLIPPVHSSIRVATVDDIVPTQFPIHTKDGKEVDQILIPKGSFVHIPVEAFNLDKEVWGDDAWEFNPDRWDNLPEAATNQPGLFSNILTFSAGPRSCIGMRFSMIEIKTFLFRLLTSFRFEATQDRIFRANVVLTRPYVAGKYKDGSQCPLRVIPLDE